MGWNLTVRKVTYLLEGSQRLAYIAEHGYDPDDVSDEFIDSQFQKLEVHGWEQNKPYNIKKVKVPVK